MCVLENGASGGSGICLKLVVVIVVCPRRREPLRKMSACISHIDEGT
jgi:hypothetical protein